MFGLGAIVVLLIAVLIVYLYKCGMFRTFHVEDNMVIEKTNFIYTEFTGNYQNLMPTINGIKNDFPQFLTKSYPQHEPKFQYFGVYYDDPKKLVDKNTGRAIIGISIQDDNVASGFFDSFLKDENVNFTFKNYKKTGLGTPLIGFGTEFKLVNFFSIVWAIMVGYAALKNHPKITSSLYSIEIYDYQNSKLSIIFPVSEGKETLCLHTKPTPPYI